jgi:hypothetical protein
MRGLIGDRLFKRFVGDILHQPGFGLPRVLGSGLDNSEATTIRSETTEEKRQAETPERVGKATDASTSENGAKPAIDENAGISLVREDSANGNVDKTQKQETNRTW